MNDSSLRQSIRQWLDEDLGSGDHSSLSCIPPDATGKAMLMIKEKGIIGGLRVAKILFETVDTDLHADFLIEDGEEVKPGDIAFYLSGKQLSILKSERLVLNIMQRMSGIATSTRQYVNRLSGLKTRILDTRKTTPGFRAIEKEAVRTGGGINHRMGLYDMIMLKDNHIDYAGGIEKAIKSARDYLNSKGLNLKIEIEARSIADVERILRAGGVDRIMLDNFSVEDTRKAVKLIAGKVETESSGGITLDTVRDYAECGVDFISAGALTHHVKSLDMSLKAV